MQISKSSWLYRMTYYHTPPSKIPEETNLCTFFWFSLLRIFVLLPLWFVWLAVGFPMGLLFAARPRIPSWDRIEDLYGHSVSAFVTYPWWPKIGPVNERVTVWPISIGAVGLLIYFMVVMFWLRVIVLSVVGVAGLAILLIYTDERLKERRRRFWFLGDRHASKKDGKPGLFALGFEYLKAKKQRYCPIITFT